MTNNEKDLAELQFQTILQIAELAASIGWVVAFADADVPVTGIVLGSPEFVEVAAPEVYGPAYAVVEEGPDGELLDVPTSNTGGKLH